VSNRDDHTNLAYWFPLLVDAGIPVPRTILVDGPSDMTSLLDGHAPAGYAVFLAALGDAADTLGYPAFLRTGLTSGKHEWAKTCFLPSRADLAIHVWSICEYSAMADFLGLPASVWAVREMLPTAPAFTAFHGFPVTRERRYFVKDGVTTFHHPYWPPHSILNPSVSDWEERLAILNHETPEEIAELTTLAERVGRAIPGYWSVDFLWTTTRGWVCIDMAEGDRSFRWDDYRRIDYRPSDNVSGQ